MGTHYTPLTRSQMVTQVTTNLGTRSNLVTSNGVIWLNWAMIDTASIFNWRSMKQLDTGSLRTRAGGLMYALPRNVKDILDLRWVNDGSNSHTLSYVGPEFFRKRWAHPESDGQGQPAIYTRDGDYLKLYPVPSESDKPLELFAAFWPAEFDSVEDANCPLERLEQAVVCRASMIGARAVGEWDKMNVFKGWYQDQIRQMQKIDGHPTDYTPQWASKRLTSDYQVGDLLTWPIAEGSTV
jgi:hypothetical protein